MYWNIKKYDDGYEKTGYLATYKGLAKSRLFRTKTNVTPATI